jgi:tetratricopeptide (TPR) repeat protein
VEGDEIVPASAMALPVSLGVALGCLALAIACVRSTLLPNSLCLAKMAEAMQTSSASGRNERVAQQLIAAAEIDPLNPDPWVLLMQLRAKPETGEIANAALEAGQEAIQRNPENPMTYELLGDLYAAVEPPSDESRAEAVKWYREAAKRYPNSAKIRTSLAIALSEGGHKEDAAKEATQSLQLDRLNQAAGHADKILTSERREMLERIAKKESKSP